MSIINKRMQWTDGQMRISTIELHEVLGYSEHRVLRLLIKRHLPLFERFGPLPLATATREPNSTHGKQMGRADRSYLLNDDQLLLLMLLGRYTPELLEARTRIAQELSFLRKEARYQQPFAATLLSAVQNIGE